MAQREAETLPLHPALSRRSSSSSRARAAAAVRPGPDPLLVICRCFSFVTSLTAILCVAVNVLSAVRSFKDGSDVRLYISKCIYALGEWGSMWGIDVWLVVVLCRFLMEYSGVMRWWLRLSWWLRRLSGDLLLSSGRFVLASDFLDFIFLLFIICCLMCENWSLV